MPVNGLFYEKQVKTEGLKIQTKRGVVCTMAVDFMTSKTKENLMRAFAGESQARNRYTIAAEQARQQGMYTIADIFEYTADQEKAHAKRFYALLKQCSGEGIHIDGRYPVDGQEGLPEQLRAAEHNEREEFSDVYPAFAEKAKEEGFFEVAATFQQIAEIEHVHEKRFGKIAEMLEKNTWYNGENMRKWMCTGCGYIHEGMQAPGFCPVCHAELGYFIPYEMACYKIGEVGA